MERAARKGWHTEFNYTRQYHARYQQPAISWLPLLSTSRININFFQTFDLRMCGWANNPKHYGNSQGCRSQHICHLVLLYFSEEIFYRPAFEDGNKASWNRKKPSSFTSIWKMQLSPALKGKQHSVSVRKFDIPMDPIYQQTQKQCWSFLFAVPCSLQDLQISW